MKGALLNLKADRQPTMDLASRRRRFGHKRRVNFDVRPTFLKSTAMGLAPCSGLSQYPCLVRRDIGDRLMPDEDAASVIFFVVSLYAFGVVLLYILARAWEQALSTRSGAKRRAAGSREGDNPRGFDPRQQ